MHDDIKKFFLSGEISGTNLVQTKERLIQAQESIMRDEGYVPDLDKEPHFTRNYIEGTDRFSFALTVYGIYVGKDKAWDTGGVMAGKIITKYTPATK